MAFLDPADSAFAALGEAATWDGEPVTVIPDWDYAEVGFDAPAMESRLAFSVRYAEVPDPERNALVVYGGSNYRVDRVEPVDATVFRAVIG